MSLSRLLLFSLFGIVIALSGCRSEKAQSASQETRSQRFAIQQHLTVNQLQNASYRVDESEGSTVQLSNGLYEGPPYVDGGASRPVFRLSDKLALGDLNGDSSRDAVVVLVSSFGGSGTFHHLKAVLSIEGEPVEAAELLLGDRIQVESLGIQDGDILLEMLTHRAVDAAPTPTLRVTKRYRLQDDRLVAQPD